MKKILFFTIFTMFFATTWSEEIKRTKQKKPQMPKKVKILLSHYWQAAQKNNTSQMEKLSQFKSQFTIDKLIAKKIVGKKVTIVPTYFEKVKHKEKVTYLTAFDFYVQGKLVQSRDSCQILEKVKGRYKITGLIGDCLE